MHSTFSFSLPLRPLLAAIFAFAGLAAGSDAAEPKKVVLIAGAPSHRPGEHEHNAGIRLLQRCLGNVAGIETAVILNGWPEDPQALRGADAVLVYSDGGQRHPILQNDHLAQLDAVLASGAGLGLLHYAVEPTREKGQEEFLRWVGGAFEIHWSVNPTWEAEFTSLPKHPVTRGVRPFAILDEWYFHLRFVPDMAGVTPLLATVPPPSTMTRPDGPHSGNPAARAAVERKEPQVLAWAYERPGGGRGFGFTGAHFHRNWGDPNFRKLVLNAIVWLAGADVPRNGVESSVSEADLTQGLDPKPPRK